MQHGREAPARHRRQAVRVAGGGTRRRRSTHPHRAIHASRLRCSIRRLEAPAIRAEGQCHAGQTLYFERRGDAPVRGVQALHPEHHRRHGLAQPALRASGQPQRPDSRPVAGRRVRARCRRRTESLRGEADQGRRVAHFAEHSGQDRTVAAARPVLPLRRNRYATGPCAPVLAVCCGATWRRSGSSAGWLSWRACSRHTDAVAGVARGFRAKRRLMERSSAQSRERFNCPSCCRC